ncbi:PAS domain-containing protein [Oricola cellulosilytica]|uniref:Blue-light-activated histidine kinase n=2 Tax=Oricola cellulosilytica TaxID=1429082 RepID=A0A4V2MN13_9HYPH|nr:PAS domain-containing protein [Oricola cellulosilytica]
MLLDRELCYVALNAAYEAVTMRRRDELLGRNLFEMFPNEGEGGRRLRQSLELVLETGDTDTLAYIPYDIPRPAELGGGMDKRYWTAVHTPIFGSDGQVSHIMQNTVDVTEMVNIRQAASLPFRSGETQLLERAREAEQQHRALLAESTDFRRLFQLAPGFIAVFSGEDHLCTFANDACLRLLGDRNLVGRTVLEVVPESGEQGFVALMDKVYRTGEPFHGEEMRFVLQPLNGGEPKEMFLDFSYDAIRDHDGAITGVFVQGMDRTQAVKTQKRQQLLLAELNHRVKNTLAAVQSIVSQTLRSAKGQDQARMDIEARLAALSKAHNVLSLQEWTSADLREVIRQELSVHDRGRVSISGPSLGLTPKASIAVAMLIHELATNAVKYGSLSTEEGRIDLEWSRTKNGQLTLKWRETGGPTVREPDRKGFGTRLIEGIVRGELRGVYEPDYAADGFSCTVVLDENELTDDNE